VKKWLLIGIALVVLCGTALAEEYDFKNTYWGMTTEEVEKAENIKIEIYYYYTCKELKS
jgi:hypothetical protein